MFREYMILLSSASVVYAWLCAIAAPLVRGVRSIADAPTRAAWIFFATAIGAALVWSAIVAAVLLLAMMLAPRAGLAVVGSDLVRPGAAGGAIAWIAQLAVSTRVPAFTDAFYSSTVLAFYGSGLRTIEPWNRSAPPAGAA